MTRYLATADVMALDSEILGRMRSIPSRLRDENALESAVMRPQMAAHYDDADLVAQAATLIAGIALAHAFVDGNKRTAFAAGRIFMSLNGLAFTGDVLELAQHVEGLVNRAGSLRDAIERFSDWLRERVIVRREA